MNHARIFLAVSAAAFVSAVCCCPLAGLVGGPRFTSGDFTDVPVYPGAVRADAANLTIDSIVAGYALLVPEAEWKRYTSRESEGDVLAWYRDELPAQGWVDLPGQERVRNGLLFVKGEDAWLVVFVMSGIDEANHTHILLGRARVVGGD